MSKFEIHAEDCPRLCHAWPCHHRNNRKRQREHRHACTCSGSRMVAVSNLDLATIKACLMYLRAELEGDWVLSEEIFDEIDSALALRPFRAETEPFGHLVADPDQPPDTISLVQVKDGKAVEVGRIENVRAEPEENDKCDLSRGD